MRLSLSPTLSDAVAQLLANLLAGGEHTHASKLARQVAALPLQQDMGGFYGLRPSGQLVEVAWDEPESLREITDQRIANMVLHRGAQCYPQLAELSPKRSDTAVTCSSCGGSGLAQVPAYLQEHVLCWCGGLGWLPSSEYELKPEQSIKATKRWWQFWRAA